METKDIISIVFWFFFISIKFLIKIIVAKLYNSFENVSCRQEKQWELLLKTKKECFKECFIEMSFHESVILSILRVVNAPNNTWICSFVEMFFFFQLDTSLCNIIFASFKARVYLCLYSACLFMWKEFLYF